MRNRSVAHRAERKVALVGLSRAVARGVLSMSLGVWCAPALADGPISVGDATDIVYDSASPAFNKQLKIKVVGCEARSSV